MHLRNLQSTATLDDAVAKLGSAKFAIGLLPWLRRLVMAASHTSLRRCTASTGTLASRLRWPVDLGSIPPR